MQELFSGATIIVRFDPAQQAIVVLARNGRAPPLTLPAHAFIDAAANGPRLELTGGFGADTKIALKLATADDAAAIARVLAQHLQLPRRPEPIAHEAIADVPANKFVMLQGRCFPYANHPVMENRIALHGVTSKVDHDAPYRVTGFVRHAPDPHYAHQVQVVTIQHLNPPVVWLTGKSVRVTYAPERLLLSFAPTPGHQFSEPAGTHELLIPTETLSSVAVDAQALVFEGDLTRTNYGTRVRLGPIHPDDARAIFILLDERLQIPRAPQRMSPADAAALTAMQLVQIEGTFRLGHIEGPNFDAGIQVQDRSGFEAGARYRITGFLYPRFVPVGPYIGYTGPRIKPLEVERLP